MQLTDRISCITAAICLWGMIALNVQAQDGPNDYDDTTSNASAMRSLRAVKLQPEKKIELDGKLQEAVWQQVPIATDFIQRSPNDGRPASEPTEVRVIYTNEELYVGIRAYDSAMDSVAATLFRKDGEAYSDWVYVNIDSYNDNRTSFSFAVNPRGVRKDILTFNDSEEDLRWDAVWEAETSLQENSWVVEMRIPLSQLRYDADKAYQQWGINFQRRLARKDEVAFWSPTPQQVSGLVSRYGTLKGIKNLSQPAHLEVSPYISGSLRRAPGREANPFYSSNEWNGSAGADIKYGLSSDFTLTGTINPDFGQVEADPAVINLSAFETFYPEQRPFFMEGSDIFQFGSTRTFNRFGSPYVFYSRRIGRAPQGRLADAGLESEFVDRPGQTTIASAAKVSGKTENGLSIGVLNALTTREKATYLSGSDQEELSIEPPTNYFAGRVKQDLNKGHSFIGGYLSSVNRFMGADYLKGFLHNSSYIGGVDFEHSWKDREWIVSGVLSGTRVNGTPEALQLTQRSSSRYFNRVDADYLSVDPDRTSLSGYAAEVSFGRFAGDHWRGSATYGMVSPGYEVNDIGFETRADYHSMSYLVTYQETDPSGPFRFYNVNLYTNQQWNFGGDLIYNAVATSGNMDFTNLWSFNYNVTYNAPTYDDRLLRGGPLSGEPSRFSYSGVLSSDPSHVVSADIGHLRMNDASGGLERDVFLDLTVRPTSYIQLTLSPNYNYQKRTGQYVRQVVDETAVDTYGRRYAFANLDQHTFSTALRLDWTFTPDISLQTYIRPYVTSGDFYRFKEFQTPGEYEFAVYGEDQGTIQQTDGSYVIDPDGTGPSDAFSFGNPDFNFRSIQSNAVFRWQYRPGATFYLVWQQERAATVLEDNLSLHRDVRGIFDTEPTNVFMVKISYWLGR